MERSQPTPPTPLLSIRRIDSRAPGLVVDGEEEVWRVGRGETVFVTRVQDAQFSSGADLPTESLRRGDTRAWSASSGRNGV